MEKKKITFGQMLADRRSRLGISQMELSERVGRSTSMISAMERGDSLPSLELAENLADALNLSSPDKKEMVNLLSYEKDAPKKPLFKTGRLIANIISDYKLDLTGMAERLECSRQYLQYIKSGYTLPSSKVYLGLRQEFRQAGAKPSELFDLEMNYLRELVISDPRFGFLSTAKRTRVAEAAVSAL
jgi:transcriptional regulator with XRE-family HTH domain